MSISRSALLPLSTSWAEAAYGAGKIESAFGDTAGRNGKRRCTGICSDAVQETILNYCNLDELQEGLIHTAYRMAVDLYRYEHPGEAAAPVMVKSISEGDTSTSFGDASEILKDSILKNYRAQLNRYRKLRW